MMGIPFMIQIAATDEMIKKDLLCKFNSLKV